MVTMCAPQERLNFLTPPTSWSHRDAIARNDEGDTTVANLLVSFIMSSCGEKCQMTSMITRSKSEMHTMVQDSLTTVLRWRRLGKRYQHEMLFRNTIGNFFDMPKSFRPLTMLLAMHYTLSHRSYDGTKCPYEWRDIVTIRTEFDFVLICVSILLQYRDSVTPAIPTEPD